MCRALAIVVLLAALAALASPLFDSNSVPLHKIAKFAPTKIPSSGLDWKMQDYLRYSDKEPLNFADNYTLLEGGCGTGCIEFCLIDRTTGTVHPGMDCTTDLPPDYKGPWGFRYRRNSRLLVVYRANNFEYPVFEDYYIWDGGRFALLLTERIQRKAKAKKAVGSGTTRALAAAGSGR